MRCVIACGVACLIAIPSLALAQKDKDKKSGDKPGCEIDVNSPAEMFSAQLYMKKATDAKTDTAEQGKDWKQAIGALSAPGFKNPNPTGRAYVISQGLINLGTRPGAPTSAPRDTYGFKDNPSVAVDPLAAADTLLTLLATQKPACVAVANSIREQGFVPLYNSSARALQANALDSAKGFAERAAQIDPVRPEAYNLLASIALKQKDNAATVANFRKAVEVAGTDTLYTKPKQSALYNLGIVLQLQADQATGDQKKDFGKQAADAWTQYLAMNPNDTDAKGALTRAQQASGDTAAVVAAFNDMITNPSKYTDLQLFQAGVAASRANRDSDATKLFNAGLTLNPYYRDALYYVAAGYFNSKQTDKLFPLARRLVDIDPNNGDNWKLLAGAYQVRANGEKGEKLLPARKADSDSTMLYFNKGKSLPVVLKVTKFAKDGDKVNVSGTVQNNGTAPKSETIKFQMLDKTGQVVASQDVPVQVPAGASQPFDFTVSAPGIAAYKYAPLD